LATNKGHGSQGPCLFTCSSQRTKWAAVLRRRQPHPLSPSGGTTNPRASGSSTRPGSLLFQHPGESIVLGSYSLQRSGLVLKYCQRRIPVLAPSLYLLGGVASGLKCMGEIDGDNPNRVVFPNRAVFGDALLPQGGRRWSRFGISFCLQCVILAALIMIPLFLPHRFEAVPRYWVTALTM